MLLNRIAPDHGSVGARYGVGVAVGRRHFLPAHVTERKYQTFNSDGSTLQVMATAGTARRGLVGSILADIRRLYYTWMELVYPRQRSAHHVLGRWTPSTTTGWIAYRAWGAVGVLVVTLLYPMTLLGVITRFYSRRIDTVLAGIGILGVMLVAALAWGALTVVARFQLSSEGFLAVGAAGTAATLSAGVAALAHKVDGRFTTVAFAYPAAMTAIFLPPAVAARYSEAVWSTIYPPTNDLAYWLLENVLWIGGLNDWLWDTFSLDATGLVLMWLAISFPLGWLLGLLVTLADVVRPKAEDSD